MILNYRYKIQTNQQIMSIINTNISCHSEVQVLINHNVNPPDHINFTFSAVNSHVFLSIKSVKCFNCGEYGHISRSCKKTNSKAPSNDTPNPLNPPPTFVHGKNKSDPPKVRPNSMALLSLLGCHTTRSSRFQ